MTDMERRRLQLYAQSIRRAALRRQIDALEYVLGPLYLELDRLDREDVDAARTAPKRPQRKARVTR